MSLPVCLLVACLCRFACNNNNNKNNQNNDNNHQKEEGTKTRVSGGNNGNNAKDFGLNYLQWHFYDIFYVSLGLFSYPLRYAMELPNIFICCSRLSQLMKHNAKTLKNAIDKK